MKQLPAIIFALGLAILFWPDGNTPAPQPDPIGPVEVLTTDDGFQTATKIKAIWRNGVAAAAKEHAKALRAGKFKDSDLAGVQAWNKATGEAAKAALDAATARGKQLHADGFKVDAAKRDEFLAEFYEAFGKGVEAR